MPRRLQIEFSQVVQAVTDAARPAIRVTPVLAITGAVAVLSARSAHEWCTRALALSAMVDVVADIWFGYFVVGLTDTWYWPPALWMVQSVLAAGVGTVRLDTGAVSMVSSYSVSVVTRSEPGTHPAIDDSPEGIENIAS